jgi:hypothetical protein
LKITQKVLILITLFTVFVSNIAIATQNSSQSNRSRKLLLNSMKASQNNQTNFAVLYFLQARKIYPGTPIPSWLKKYSLPGNNKEEQQLFFELTKNLDYSKAKKLYEERLNLNPGNISLRKKLLQIAEKNKDEKQILRHKSALKIKDDYYWILRLFIGIVLILLIIFNGYKLLKTLKRQPEH